MGPNRHSRRHYTYTAPPHYRNSRPVTRQQDAGFTIHDPPLNQLRQCRLAVTEANDVGDILTWSPIGNSPLPINWHPPCRTTVKGTITQFAASAYNNLPPALLNAPHCPHAINGFNLAEDTLMSAQYSKQRGWYFQAKKHKCEFKFNIPPLGASSILPSDNADEFDDPDAGHFADSDDQDESFEMMALDADCAEKVRNVNDRMDDTFESWPPPYRSDTSFPSYLSSSPISSLPPSSPIASTSSSPIRPRPKPYNGTLKPYFSKDRAKSRICPDSDFRNRVMDKQTSGLYKKYPEEHPAWKSSLAGCIPMMLSFHPQTPGSMMPPMSLMTKLCGQMISQVNSTMGLPKATFLRLLLQSLDCKGCNCSYSVEAYHDHRRLNPQTGESVCANTPELFPIEELYPELAGLYDLATRTYPLGAALPSHADHLNTTLGRAWVTWNSRIGITKDVWAVISTAWTHCRDCDLVRTFDCDRAHRDGNFLCRDVGQGQVSTVLGSITRVNSVDGTMVVWKMN